MIDKILHKIQHWSTRLLYYAGRIQLIKSVLFSICNYWMQIFPLPKKVILHIEALCRTFLWTGGDLISRKAPVAWNHVWDPVSAGGLNLLALLEWNKATIGKLLWNICQKSNKLWVKWVHTYYIKGQDISDYQPATHCSWVLKAIFK